VVAFDMEGKMERFRVLVMKMWHWGFLGNAYVFWHGVLGGIAAIFLEWLRLSWTAIILNTADVLLLVFLGAVLWELWQNFRHDDVSVVNEYGNEGWERFYWDSVGDVIASVLIAALVVFRGFL
jgi:hypothetical protein